MVTEMNLMEILEVTSIIDITREGYPKYEFKLCPDCHEHFLKKVVTKHYVTYWVCTECGYMHLDNRGD